MYPSVPKRAPLRQRKEPTPPQVDIDARGMKLTGTSVRHIPPKKGLSQAQLMDEIFYEYYKPQTVRPPGRPVDQRHPRVRQMLWLEKK